MGLKLPTKSTLSHVANIVTPSVARPAITSLVSTVKEHPNVALAALAVVNPIAAVAVVGAEHKGEIKSTLSHAGAEIKKDAGIV